MFDRNAQTKLYNTLMGNPGTSGTGGYNAIGRTAGASGGGDNFFVKRGKSIENALGTTLSAGYGLAKDIGENYETRMMLGRQKGSLDNIYRQYGFKDRNDYINQLDAAEAAGDRDEVERLYNLPGLKDKISAQANANAAEATSKANNYNDYRNNSYISNKINQDRGKFAGSAINTLSTALDVTGLTSNPLANAIQGGVEGVADELEQNGLQNFDWNRAGQNALVGATTGAVTGVLNKGLNKLVDPKTGNLFKGGNKLTNALNNLGSKTAIGRGLSTIATGAARGAISGAVGGATGAGTSAFLNGGDVIGSALQGAGQGLGQGALTGGIMSGVNMGLSKTPFMQQINQAKQNWDQSGKNFNERLTNTLNSGDSAVGNWLNRDSSSRLLNSIGNVGESVRDYTDKGLGPRKAEQEAYKDLIKEYYDENGVEGAMTDAEAAGYPGDSNFRKAQRLVEGGSLGVSIDDAFNGLKDIYGDDFNPDIYLNKDGSYKYKNGEPYVWTIYKNKLAMALSREMDAAQNSPQTVGEWAKRAGERIVEDANNRGVGMGVKDVANEPGYSDDIRNMKINNNMATNAGADDVSANLDSIRNSINNENISYSELAYLESHPDEVLATGDPELAQWAGIDEDTFRNYQDANTPTNTRTQQLDAWDRLAQQNGYRSYDDVIQSYMEANPNARINPNGMAGAITTWMDENPGDWNPNQPQTAGQWAKRAGERLVEDANNRGVGMSVRDTSQESPETLMYRQLNNQNGDMVIDQELEPVFEPEARNQIESQNKLQSVGKQLQNAAKQQKYRSVYGALDSKTAQRAVETNAPEVLAEMGVKPENYLEAAKVSNYVNQVASDLAKDSDVKVYIPDMAEKLASATDGVIMSDNARKTYNDIIKQIVADGSTPDEYTAGYLLEKSRELGSRAVNVRGNRDDADAVRTALKDAKYILRDAVSDAAADAKVTGDATNAQIAQGLKKMGANQKIIDYITEPVDGKAPDLKTYIRRTSTFEQARDMGEQMNAEKLTRSASKEPTRGLTRLFRASGLDQPLEILLNNTVAPVAGFGTKLVGKTLEGIGNVGAKLAGKGTTGGDVSVATPIAGTGYNPATQIYNAIGRTEGANAAQQTRAGRYLNDAAQANSASAGYAEPLGATTSTAGTGTLESLVPTTTTGATNSLYNSFYGTQSTPTFASQEEERAVYFFPPTGDAYTDMISRAMRRAKNAEDYDALGQLYNMYQNSVSNLQSQSTSASTNSGQKLTATQQRAGAAMDSLDRLEKLTPDFAYNLSSIPVVGNIATFGGNDYEAEARSLAQQIGYMVSGSNISKTEAENIGKSYVPQPWDNEKVRENKLIRARETIQRYLNGYAE